MAPRPWNYSNERPGPLPPTNQQSTQNLENARDMEELRFEQTHRPAGPYKHIRARFSPPVQWGCGWKHLTRPKHESAITISRYIYSATAWPNGFYLSIYGCRAPFKSRLDRATGLCSLHRKQPRITPAIHQDMSNWSASQSYAWTRQRASEAVCRPLVLIPDF